MQARPFGIIPSSPSEIDRPRPVRLILLGASGSIGRQTIDVVRAHPDQVSLVGLAAKNSVDDLVELAHEFPSIKALAFADPSCKHHPALSADHLRDLEIGFGQQSVYDLACSPFGSCVLNALVGFAGTRASYNALASGHELALANKESLVVAGDLIMPLAKPSTLFPVDSEHSAIYQCFLGNNAAGAQAIWLTASGGPFLGKRRPDLECVSAAQALAHPRWNMGSKVSIDSATLMNKGLEVIEAHHLFGMSISDIHPLVHPQSAIHSMVQFCDGSVIAQIGPADMRLAIQFALSAPQRWSAVCEALDFPALGHMDFALPDLDTFGCLRLALEAARYSNNLPCILNAADEIAVEAFLHGACSFLDIERIVEKTLDHFDLEQPQSLDHLEQIDAEARLFAQHLVETIA